MIVRGARYGYYRLAGSRGFRDGEAGGRKVTELREAARLTGVFLKRRAGAADKHQRFAAGKVMYEQSSPST